jgi:hypothetical protein
MIKRLKTSAMLLLIAIVPGSFAFAQSVDYCVQQTDDTTLKNNCDFQINVMYYFPDRASGQGCTFDAPCGSNVAAQGIFQSVGSLSGARIGACKWPQVPVAKSDRLGISCSG